jgi:hypothetical protein
MCNKRKREAEPVNASKKSKRQHEYFAEPVWGATHAGRGGSGTRMEVILGPNAVASTNYGSKPGPTSIHRCMKPLNALNFSVTRTGVKKGKWIAGHLMNDNMGGSGVLNTNLTALTGTANKQHSGYEGKIKAALTVSGMLERFNHIPEFTFGVDYKVEAVGRFGIAGAHALAPEYIEFSSKLVKLDATTGAISDATDMDIERAPKDSRKTLKAVTFSNVKVHNRQEHL